MSVEVIRFEGPRELAGIVLKAPALFLPEAKASRRFWEFFTANISNRNTRRAYYKAVCRFSQWCEARGLAHLESVQPIHIAAFIEELELSKPTIKQHLAALRMLFDWLVVGHIIETNPAHAVRGPKHSVKKGETPVLTAEEARTLLDSIPLVRTVKLKGGGEKDVPYVTGMRDRALIGLMVFTFARVGAAVGMRVEDYFIQGRRGWIRLHEKGGKRHDVPANHNLDQYLETYIESTGLGTDPKGPLFRTVFGKTDRLMHRPMSQADAYRMIPEAGESRRHSYKDWKPHLPSNGITAYLKNGGRLEVAQQIAAHESSRTTGLCDRRATILAWMRWSES